MKLLDEQQRKQPGGATQPRQVAAPAEPGQVQVGTGHLHRLASHHDKRGTLVVAQSGHGLPFEPVRIFQVMDVAAGVVRGDHAHRLCHQFIIATCGAATIVVDDSRDVYQVRLDNPDLGIHIPPLTWSAQMDFEPDTRLLICASEFYDENDYIDDYGEFTRLAADAPS